MSSVAVQRAVAALTRLHALRLRPASPAALALRVLKALAAFLLLLNCRSWPLSWHFRVFRPVYYLRVNYCLFRLSLLFRPKRLHNALTTAWYERLSAVGADPFDYCVGYKTWAGPDDCDFNMHLSNSCYPKTLDCARFQAALRYFPTFFRVGGWSPLGATHFSFLREIPIFSRYEVRVSLAGWGDKWVYVLARYVTPAGKGARSKAGTHSRAPSAAAAAIPQPVLHTPVSPQSTTLAGSSSGLAALAAGAARTPEPDGATLHCVGVSAICFKIGRLTVPPALVFAAEGFCGEHARGAGGVPAHWETVQRLRAGDLRALRRLFAGGWREVPEEERWWASALGGDVERRRAAGMRVVEGLRGGWDELKEMTLSLPVA